jgi:D-aspartate ligase
MGVMPLTALRDASAPEATDAGAGARDVRRGQLPTQVRFSIHGELSAVEHDWRRFQERADCTVFQTYDWLATWQTHIGLRHRVKPAIVVGRFSDGDIAFLLPLCIERKYGLRRLRWLGQDLCDYNAPLLARGFSQRVEPDRFLAIWQILQAQMQSDPLLRHDWIDFAKMPKQVGDQINPFTHLAVTPNASGTHLAHLSGNWEAFYVAKRSSSTRRRDRTKRAHLAKHGDIGFFTATDAGDAQRTVETLMEQKSRSFARKGIPDLFARPGHREFFLDLATNPATRQLVHISRTEVGATSAAANLGLVFGDCYYHVLASYTDSELSNYGPGNLHLREMMAYAIGRGLKRFDFTIGDEPYKLEWSDTDTQLNDFAAPVTWRGQPASLASDLRRYTKRLIKQTPWLWRLAADIRSRMGSKSLTVLLRSPRSEAPSAGSANKQPVAAVTACVMGDMDLVRPLALAGIPFAVAARPGSPSLYSRHARASLPLAGDAEDHDAMAAALIRFGETQGERPVLFYEEDGQTLTISRHRERLAQAFRFVIPDAQLVEDLLDKARFQALAERLRLPVPAGRHFDPATLEPADLGLAFPLIIKPPRRDQRWSLAFGLRKALYVESAEQLSTFWPLLHKAAPSLIAQEFVPGGEASIESYHAYVDQRGAVAAEFTGAKLRTYPPRCGHTSALKITDADDVRREGRSIVERLRLTGVAKLDFKRDPQGRLHLLEINPRFNLWHHAGALAGVNIPAFVYADLTGTPRPQQQRAKAGVRWCRPWTDFAAARAAGISPTTWLSFAIGCEAKSALAWDDPLPLIGASFHRLAAPYLSRGKEAAPLKQNRQDRTAP